MTSASKPKGGWLLRVAGIAVLIFNVVGLPLRLFWEAYFKGVGVICFIVGMIIGGMISPHVRTKLRLRGRIVFFGAMAVGVIVMYPLYISSVDQVEPSNYSLSARQFWELFLYGAINLCWGLCAEVAANTTTSLGKGDAE